MKDDTKVEKDKKNLHDDAGIKQMLDDAFLLDYLVMTSIDTTHEILTDKSKQELVQDLTNKMIDKIVELNADLPEEALEQLLGQKIAMVRSKREASLVELENKFNERINLFVNKILSFSFR